MKASLRMIGLFAVLSLIVTSCSHGGNGSSSSTASSESGSLLASAPARQKKFCTVIVKYEPPDNKDVADFMSGQMSAARKRQFTAKMSANRAARKAEITSLLGAGKVEGWVGKVVSVRNATSSDLAVNLNVGCDAHFEAVALDSALTAQTVIPKSSPLYAVAGTLKEDQRVIFSGHLIRKVSLPDGYQELSAGDFPSLDEPRFNFDITKLAPAQ